MAFDSIAFSFLVPGPLLLLLAAATAALFAFSVWRKAKGALWRGGVLAVLLLALTGPTLIAEERESRDDIAVIVLDRSPSQGIGDRTAAADAALEELKQRLARYPDLEVRIVEAARADAREDAGTELMAALAQAFSDVPRDQIAGAVLITDGQIHDAADATDPPLPAPLHVLLTGDPRAGDRRLVIEQAPSYGIIGSELEVRLRVTEAGAPSGEDTRRPAVITLRQDGGPIERHTVFVGDETRIPFTLEHGGRTVVELAVEAGAQELTMQNNRAALSMTGVRDRLRVLLVSGEPHAGERTWRNLLKADPAVDLVHFTILRPPEKQDGTPVQELSLIAFPTRELFEIKLDEFDLIIFDRYRRRGVLLPIYVENIAAYVENGGALLAAAGPEFATRLSLYRTPLGLVLPAQPTGTLFEQGFKPAVTEVGARHPVTAELEGAGADGGEPEWGRWFRMVESRQTGGTAVLSGVEGQPLLVLSRTGEGRVAQLLSDHAWLWARNYEGGGPQAELLRRLAHWLMKEPDLEEEELRALAAGNRINIERRSLSADGPPVTLTGPDGSMRVLSLSDAGGGRAAASVATEDPGLYRLSDGTHTTVVAVGAVNPREFADVRASAEILAPLAEATGGGVVWLSETGTPDLRRVRPGRPARGRGWIGLQANESYFVTGVRQVSLLPPWALLVLLVGGLMLAWTREGR
ncbi:MAG TPA: hypothetical protein QF665_02900 [Alphaproteobacteria bacterium]|nr:hypothetical protein [Alphaproteobacteria bacterium]